MTKNTPDTTHTKVVAVALCATMRAALLPRRRASHSEGSYSKFFVSFVSFVVNFTGFEHV
jgi:hypothetical protein